LGNISIFIPSKIGITILKKSKTILMVETHLRSMNQARNAEYLSESLSITVRFTCLDLGLNFEVSSGITVSEISRDEINEIMIGLPM